MNPTARALLALEMIQGAPGITAERLGERLGVSERAARRYVGVLRDAGIPIESVRGPYGGYRVGRGLRLPPLVFTASEALGLVMAVLDGHHAAADPTDPVGSALGKLVCALPAPVAATADAVRRTAAAAPDRAAARPDPEVTTTLVQACAEHRSLRLGYRTEAGTELAVEVEAWAVVVRHGRWYLLCRVREADAVRTYRIDRVRHAEMLAETFRPPAGLDPVAALEENLGSGWEHPADVLLDLDPARADRVPRVLGRCTTEGGRTRLVGSTSNPAWYVQQVAALECGFTVLGGAALVDAARALAARVAASVSG